MLKNYFKVAVRSLLKNRAFSLINIFGLAIGLAGFGLIYMYVDLELSYDKFHTDSHLLYRVTTDQVVENVVGTRDAESFAPEGKVLMDELPEITAYTTTQKLFGNFDLRIGEKLFTEKSVVAADTNFLRLFNYPIINGDMREPLKDPNTIILTTSIAKKYFGNEDPIGKIIHVYSGFNRPFTVVATIADVPENTHYKFDMLISFESIRERWERDEWGGFNYYTYIKVTEGSDMKALKTKMWALSEKYLSDQATLYFTPQPVEDIHLYSNITFEPEVHGSMKTVYFLGVIALFIIVIAWVNYINLSTAKAMDRAREVGMRKVVGAKKVQLISQFMMESVLINFLSAIIAITIIQLTSPAFNDLIGKQVLQGAWLNTQLLVAMLGLTFVGSILSGVYPAMILSSFKPVAVLKGKLRTSLKGILLRKGLVIFQFCTSLALIAGTMIVYIQIEYMRNRDLGIDTEQVLVVTEPSFGSADSLEERKLITFQNRVRQIASVAHVGSASSVPGSNSSDISSFSGGLRLDGEAESDRATFYAVYTDEKYADALGIKLLAGRNFIKSMALDTASAIINETVMERLGFNSPEDAVNHYVQLGSSDEAQRYTIIGVFRNFNRQTLKNSYEPTLFFYNESRSSGYQTVKFQGNDVRHAVTEIENVWYNLFPNAPFEYIFLDDKFDIAYREDRRFGLTFSIFAVLAIIIACLGLFGLSSFIAVQKTKEIGVRKVLGASVSSILYLLSKDFIKLVLYGLLIGIPVVFLGMDQWLDNYAFRIDFPWWVFLAAGMMLLLITLFTVSFQTLKAALSNPSKALRYE